jgi:hypothetical protein
MYAGEHYLVRSAKDFYRPSSIDKDSLLLNLIIQPLYCSHLPSLDPSICSDEGV